MKRFMLAGLLAIFVAAPVQAAEVTQIQFGTGGSLTITGPLPAPADPAAGTATLGFASTGGVISPGAAVSLVSFQALANPFDIPLLAGLATITGSFGVGLAGPPVALGTLTAGGAINPGAGPGVLSIFGFIHCNQLVAGPCTNAGFTAGQVSVPIPLVTPTLGGTILVPGFPFGNTGNPPLVSGLNPGPANLLAFVQGFGFPLGGNIVSGFFAMGGQEIYRQTVQTPEPGTALLTLAGLGLLAGAATLRRRAR